MQARIQSLQATLASDSSQHAAAYSQLQQQHEQLHRERDAASHKGNNHNSMHSFTAGAVQLLLCKTDPVACHMCHYCVSHVCVHVGVSVYLCMCGCVYVCMCICMCICMHACECLIVYMHACI